MGLFINDSQHPGVYKNTGELNEPNQDEFRKDYLSELIKEQQISNKSFHRAIYGLRNSHNKLSQRQIRQWREVDKQLNDLKELQQRHEKLEREVMDWLKKLEIRNLRLQMIMRNEQIVKKNLIGQVEGLGQSQEEMKNRLSQFEGTSDKIDSRLNQIGETNGEIVNRLDQFGATNEEIVNGLSQLKSDHEEIFKKLEHLGMANDGLVKIVEQYGEANEQMLVKVEDQYELHKIVADQIFTIEETQKEVLNRVDDQEGLMEKTIRQIDHVRSVLFERTAFLEEKIEKVYNFTTTYIQKMKNSSGQQLTLVMNKGKDDEGNSEGY